jgi:ankyrin repeat protein
MTRYSNFNHERFTAQTLMRSVSLCLLFLFGFPGIALAEQTPKSLEARWVSAISNDRVDELSELLNQSIEAGKDPLNLLQLDAPNGKSALMVACKRGDLAFSKRMVQLGANINEVTLTGGTPLMFAVLGHHIDIADWLLSIGANLEAQGSNGWSAATIAGAKGQTQVLAWLINSGIDIDMPDVYGFTPLMRAVDNMHFEAARILVNEGGADVAFTDESGNGALHYATANRQLETIELLLSHGANPLQKNRDGITPKDIANNDSALLQLLDSVVQERKPK